MEKITCANSTYIEVENRANLRFSHEENLYPQTKGVVVGNGSAAGVSLERYDISKKRSTEQRFGRNIRYRQIVLYLALWVG